MPRGTLLLSRAEVTALLSLDDCIAAVERAFLLHAEGSTLGPGVLGIAADGGGFHVKAAGLRLERTWFALKCNGNFFHNSTRFGLPNIQGLIILCDGETGYPVAVIDSIQITTLRTAAATAVAARLLSHPESKVVTVVGCGTQGRAQLLALSRVRRVETVQALDIDPGRARVFAQDLSREMGIQVRVTEDLAAAVRQSDICVTCTPSRQGFMEPEHLPPGLFLAAVGADSHDKQELDPRILASNKVVADILDQCAAFGEVHHALSAGLMTRDDVHAELSDVLAGRRPGRTSPDEVIVFDSTGTALQDVAAAVAVYEKATAAGSGRTIDMLG